MGKVEEIVNYLNAILPELGVNKQRELSRLIYEICKRDGIAAEEALPVEKNLSFERAKKILLKKRYPCSFSTAAKSAFYLPKLEFDPAQKADLQEKPFSPKHVYIENSVKDSALAQRAKKMFPQAEFYVWDGKQKVGSAYFSRRTDTLLIHQEKYDFLKPCPCSQGNAGCGYNLINLGFGCRFECEYCFLQQYQNLHAVLLPANVQDFLDKIDQAQFRKGPFDRVRIGSGEFTDSLVFDELTQYSHDLVPFFKQRPHLQFEFKTKSTCINGLLKEGGAENVVISWSVNAPKFIEQVEHFTPSLTQRLSAAKQVAQAGYRLGFHFDPVVPFEGWKEAYLAAAEQIADSVPNEKVAWISVGLLRFSRELKKVVENRFPENWILDGEFLLEFDGKMRYPESLRQEAYEFFIAHLKKLFPQTKVYVCMEKPHICSCSL
ncbi:MAG: hypothetical protein IKL48_05590 [Elusimicrobiaceae bacterium]|nr:hypothetical protein [Elusimicrobiaceae bacterium]